MNNVDIVRLDEGGVNARILAREAQADFRRVERASLKFPTRFSSAEGKRFFIRMFNTLQLNDHFISVLARTKLDAEEVAKVEDALEANIDAAAEKLNQAIDGTEALFRANGVSKWAEYDTVPLDVNVPVLSSNGRRYLELLVKLDQLMPLLQTLQILDLVTRRDIDEQRAVIKREVRNVANSARNFAAGLRRRMNQLDAAAQRRVDEAARPRLETGHERSPVGPKGDAEVDVPAASAEGLNVVERASTVVAVETGSAVVEERD